jgi:hypothetical protein
MSRTIGVWSEHQEKKDFIGNVYRNFNIHPFFKEDISKWVDEVLEVIKSESTGDEPTLS